MQWYYNVLARRPYLIVLFITVFCTACIIVSLTSNTLPDFTDPTLGFETRGTEIGKRLIAWHNLIQETGQSNLLVADPIDLNININTPDIQNRKNRKRKHRKKHKKQQNQRKKNKFKNKGNLTTLGNSLNPKHLNTNHSNDFEDGDSNTIISWHGDNGIFKDYEFTNESSANNSVNGHRSIYGLNMTFVDEEDHKERIQTKKSTWFLLQRAELSDSSETLRLPIEGYFCNSPAKEYSHFVVERTGPNSTDSLFNINSILAMCQLQDQITGVNNYDEFCERELINNNCCRPWSLANYASLLANKRSCFDLTQEDVLVLHNLLLICFEYFYDLNDFPCIEGTP